MAVARYEPWTMHRDLWNEFNKMLDRMPNNDASSAATADWIPAVDIEEHVDRYVLRADVPGVEPSAIEITLENGVLTLSGTREQVVEKNGAVEHRRVERVAGRFLRRFALPDTVDGEAVKASGKNGVLEITIPKRASSQPRRINVNA
jgi:HSP20 family protein